MLMGICCSIVLMLLVLLPGQPLAKIRNGIACSTCHTMHNSQNNVTLTAASTQGLLKSTCIGCHQGENSATSIGEGFPYVFNTDGPQYGNTGTSGHNTLAGGDFYWVKFVDDRRGHNVVGIAGEDGLYGGTADTPGSETDQNQLTCAGIDGCHGDRTIDDEIKSLMPAHHKAAELPLSGDSVDQSYRFLDGVKGIEDGDWEFTVGSGDHNQYKGGTSYDDDGSSSKSITGFCVDCHGQYHGQYTSGPGGTSINGNQSTPWLRHPTDIDLGDSEFDSTEYDGYTVYNPIAPVASSKDPLTSLVNTDVRDGDQGIITCITCHRAHGSPYEALLRWNYKGWPDGSCSECDGCQICHGNKD